MAAVWLIDAQDDQGQRSYVQHRAQGRKRDVHGSRGMGQVGEHGGEQRWRHRDHDVLRKQDELGQPRERGRLNVLVCRTKEGQRWVRFAQRERL